VQTKPDGGENCYRLADSLAWELDDRRGAGCPARGEVAIAQPCCLQLQQYCCKGKNKDGPGVDEQADVRRGLVTGNTHKMAGQHRDGDVNDEIDNLRAVASIAIIAQISR
jgi:hypothetical protein